MHKPIFIHTGCSILKVRKKWLKHWNGIYLLLFKAIMRLKGGKIETNSRNVSKLEKNYCLSNAFWLYQCGVKKALSTYICTRLGLAIFKKIEIIGILIFYWLPNRLLDKSWECVKKGCICSNFHQVLIPLPSCTFFSIYNDWKKGTCVKVITNPTFMKSNCQKVNDPCHANYWGILRIS